jgi:hypothetical protein
VKFSLGCDMGQSWAGTCRRLFVTLKDGTLHLADLNFTRQHVTIRCARRFPLRRGA